MSADEPIIPSTLPEKQWEKIGTDLFEQKASHTFCLVDYFSRYVEVVKLTCTTTKSVVAAMKPLFARHGIPDVIISDNSPQYSQEFQQFGKDYELKHMTSSPQGYGEAERAVKTVKKLLRDTSDHNLALLTYQSSPSSWCKHSPAQLIMDKQICSTLPISTKSLIPK